MLLISTRCEQNRLCGGIFVFLSLQSDSPRCASDIADVGVVGVSLRGEDYPGGGCRFPSVRRRLRGSVAIAIITIPVPIAVGGLLCESHRRGLQSRNPG